MKLVFLILISFLYIPHQNTDKITWNENQKLTWADFRGKPIASASFVASTKSGINLQYSYTLKNNDVNISFTLTSFFEPSGSWYKPSQVNDHILRHEQAHFDISELHARKLRKKMEEKRFSKKIKSEVTAIYNEIEQQRRAMQTKFDAESDHSRNIENEAQWQKFIAQQLAEYESWK